jgi:parvulin-like peptidyl-prolyl isomerase
MADDEKKPVQSLPPPTEEVDEEWGSSSGASSRPPAKDSGAKSTEDAKPKTASKPAPAGAKKRDRDEDDEDDEDEDEDEDRDEDDEDEDEDEDRDEDDEDEDEDEDDRRKARAKTQAKARAAAPRKPKAAAQPPAQDWLPDWAPWATLGALLIFGFLGGVGAIPLDFNLKKSAAPESSATVAVATAPAPTTSTRLKRANPAAQDGANDPTAEERVAASHLLVSFQGAMRAQPSVTRSKDEAKQRAMQALARAKKGEPFEKLVAEFSDEPGAAARGGKLGKFSRRAMVKEFSDAAFAMKVGEISELVETKFGYHVIKRTE